jgi:hypothetical protein
VGSNVRDCLGGFKCSRLLLVPEVVPNLRRELLDTAPRSPLEQTKVPPTGTEQNSPTGTDRSSPTGTEHYHELALEADAAIKNVPSDKKLPSTGP